MFKISLAQWSLHRKLRSGELEPLQFPIFAANTFDIDAVEYVSTFYADKATDEAYLNQLKKVCKDHGVQSLLIMVDGEGALGDPDGVKRAQAVQNHHKWVDAAKALGCHSIRVNAQSAGERDEQRKLAADGLHALCLYADNHDINVLVENHGGLSSDGAWLVSVMETVDHPRIGTLPDFGNFCFDWGQADDPDAWYDRYQGVDELMPFAKAVSAKSNAFDEEGNETKTDYRRMMQIVLEHDYHGHVGIEYEGDEHGEVEGIQLTKALLERVRRELREQPVAEKSR